MDSIKEENPKTIDLYAITIHFIFVVCFQKMEQDLAIKTQKSHQMASLFELLQNIGKHDSQIKKWASIGENRLKYLRKYFKLSTDAIQQDNEHLVVSVQYVTFFPLMQYMGINGYYTRLNELFNPNSKKQYKIYTDGGFFINYIVTEEMYLQPPATVLADNLSTSVPVVNSLKMREQSKVQEPRSFLPAKPTLFIGRKQLLQDIYQAVVNTEEQITVLSGIGGMGKTALMQQFLHQYDIHSCFDRIVYFAVDKELGPECVRNLIEQLKIQYTPDSFHSVEAQMSYVARQMQSIPGKNLVIIDNVNEADFSILQAMRRSFLDSGWKYFITSRTVPDGFFAIDVPALAEDDAIKLFIHHYSERYLSLRPSPNELKAAQDQFFKNEGVVLKQLLEKIDRHTLLTELLAKSAVKKELSLQALLDRLIDQDFRHPDLQQLVYVGEHSQGRINSATVYSYLLRLFDVDYLLEGSGDDDVDLHHRRLVDMLRLFSVLPSFDIPLADINKLWQYQQEDLIQLENLLDELRQMGWLQLKIKKAETGLLIPAFFKMHKLIQEVVYEKLKPNLSNCAPLSKELVKLLDEKGTGNSVYLDYAKGMLQKLTTIQFGSPRMS